MPQNRSSSASNERPNADRGRPSGRRPRLPNYRRQKRAGGRVDAFTVLDGHRYHLGEYGSPESIERYHRIHAMARVGTLPPPRSTRLPTAELVTRGVDRADGGTTILELCAAFEREVRETRRDPAGTLAERGHELIRMSDRFAAWFGHVQVDDFRKAHWRDLIDRLVETGRCRSGVNRSLTVIRGIFEFGVGEDLVSAVTFARLKALKGIRRGQTPAPESTPVRPVPIEDVEAVRPFVSSVVWTMIQVQLLTAARPGEIVALRAIDLDTSGDVWTATLTHHKNAHRGSVRMLAFGRRAQRLLKPFLDPACERLVDAPIFDPHASVIERRRRTAHGARRPGQLETPRQTERTLGPGYTTASYARAVTRACELAGVTRWTPNQLRHTRATELRHRYGLDATQACLGHAHADVTQVYAEVRCDRVIQIAREVG